MTDNEIIKAMQCVIGNSVDCTQCEYQETLPFPSCMRMCAENALDLIKRQKAEIKRLAAKILVKDNITDYNTAQLRIAREELRTAKSEAIKEFAERLKKELQLDDDCNCDCENCNYECKEYVPLVDNLVKEMTKGE